MKKAFTLIELVFVLVIIGVLAAVILPRTKTNPLQEAAIQLASHIRYTQHLAMSDDTYNAKDDQWYKGRWQLVFSSSKYTGGDDVWAYTIFSDKPSYGGDASIGEIALNPANKNQFMTGGYGKNEIDFTDKINFKGMKKLNIGTSYGIVGEDALKFDGGCKYYTSKRITFDYIGRPFRGDSSSMTKPYNTSSSKRVMSEDCEIKLTKDSQTVTIKINKETGFVQVLF